MPGVNVALVRNHGGAIQRPAMGYVVHHAVGNLAAALSRFNDPSSEASAHFFIAYDGTITQLVDSDLVAYHACLANWTGWYGVEHESPPSDSPDVWQGPTGAQIAASGAVLRWLHDTEGIPLRVTDQPDVGGVAYHSMVPGPCGSAWGLTGCPGDAFIASRSAIVAAASGVAPVPVPIPEDDDVSNVVKWRGALLSFTVNESGDVLQTDSTLQGTATRVDHVIAHGARPFAPVAARLAEGSDDILLFATAPKGGAFILRFSGQWLDAFGKPVAV